MKFLLPKGYLSSSACDLWEHNKQQFRERYYMKQPGFSSPYTDFGRDFAHDLEHNPSKYPWVPRYALAEFPIKWVVEGVPVLGYLDSFCPATKSIMEYKTGLDGGNGWTAVKVRKWSQLPFYAMCIKEMFGEVNPVIKLVWMKTKWEEVCKEQQFGSTLLRECKNELTLVDKKPVVFDREIRDFEITYQKDRLTRIGKEVTKDYNAYLKTVDKL